MQLCAQSCEPYDQPKLVRMQVCNNLALAGEMAAVSEALALGARLGLDPALLSGVFNASSARCWSSDSYNPAPVRPSVNYRHSGCCRAARAHGALPSPDLTRNPGSTLYCRSCPCAVVKQETPSRSLYAEGWAALTP